MRRSNRVFSSCVLGDAVVYSESIVTAGGLDRVRPLMGVCPQFDTGLWDLLTGREHLILFASIKGLPSSARASEAAKLLEDVKVSMRLFLNARQSKRLTHAALTSVMLASCSSRKPQR